MMTNQLGEVGTGRCLRCGQCARFINIKPESAVNPENRNYGGWCACNGMTTAPEMLRCGGDDFQRREDPFAPKAQDGFSAVQIEHMVQSTKPGDVERLQAQAAAIAALPSSERKKALALMNAHKSSCLYTEKLAPAKPVL